MLQKVIVTSEKLRFPVGARLGIATNYMNHCREFVRRIAGREHEYEVITPLSFKKGSVLWADHVDCKRAEGEFEIVPMPVGYMQEDPIALERRARHLTMTNARKETI